MQKFNFKSLFAVFLLAPWFAMVSMRGPTPFTKAKYSLVSSTEPAVQAICVHAQ
jgi:hypothetical protein